MFVLFQVTVLVNFNKPAVYLRHKVILKNIGNQTVLVTIDVQCPVSVLVDLWNIIAQKYYCYSVMKCSFKSFSGRKCSCFKTQICGLFIKKCAICYADFRAPGDHGALGAHVSGQEQP